VETELAVSGWRVEPLRWATDAGAVLAVRGPGDAAVEVLFTIGARGKKSTVGVEFRVADPAGVGGVKPVVEAVAGLLREPPAPGAQAASA